MLLLMSNCVYFRHTKYTIGDEPRSLAISGVVANKKELERPKHQYGTILGYEPADLTVHPPPPELPRVGSFFSYRCLVFPKKCPQRKA